MFDNWNQKGADRAAAAGAARLDADKPQWAIMVNPTILNLDNSFFCVLGQVYGHFGDGLKRLGLDSRKEWIKVGFEPPFFPNYTERHLRRAWCKQIKARLAKVHDEDEFARIMHQYAAWMQQTEANKNVPLSMR